MKNRAHALKNRLFKENDSGEARRIKVCALILAGMLSLYLVVLGAYSVLNIKELKNYAWASAMGIGSSADSETKQAKAQKAVENAAEIVAAAPTPVPTPAPTPEPTPVPEPENLLLVNSAHRLPDDYQPENLVSVDPNIIPHSGEEQLDADTYNALQKLYADGVAAGYDYKLISGFRDMQLQAQLYAASGGSGDVAAAGFSEHHTGLAVDLSGASVGYSLTESFGDNPDGIWLAENAHKYGFIVRFQESWLYEPWHLRFVGVKHATAIYESGVNLETYLWE